jgi:predicted transposase YdaD
MYDRSCIWAKKKAKDTARYLADRTRKEIADPQTNRGIMEMLSTILIYTFNNLSRAEVEKMLGVDITLQQTRFYKDVEAEGEAKGQRSILLTQLDRKLGKLPVKTKKTIAALDLAKLQSLAIALFDFETIADLESWLKQD